MTKKNSQNKTKRAYEITRYLIAGVGITLLSQLIYIAFLKLNLTPSTSWGLSFIFGIAAGYIIHGRYVFRSERRTHHWISFPTSYLLRFMIGQGVLSACLKTGLSEGWAGLVANILLAPLGYLLLRLTLRGSIN